MQIEMSVSWNMAALVIVLIQIPLLFVFALTLVLSSMLMEELARVSTISKSLCFHECIIASLYPYKFMPWTFNQSYVFIRDYTTP